MNHRIKLALGTTMIVIGLTASLSAMAQEEKQISIEIRNQHEISTDCEDGEDCHRRIFVHRIGDDDGGGEDRTFAFGSGDHHGWSVTTGGTFLGIELTALTPELRSHFGVPGEVGVMVSRVTEDGPAEAAGIEVGDIVTAVDDVEVSSSRSLARAIRSREAGDTVVVEIWRDGGLLHRTAALAERKATGHNVFSWRSACEDGDDDCDFDFGTLLGKHGATLERLKALPLGGDFHATDFGCEGRDCTIIIKKVDGEFQCTINGEPQDCGNP